MTRVEKALQYHKQGYNCGQAVFCSFVDLMDIDEKTALKLSHPLGRGLANLREVCGVIIAMSLVLGTKLGSDNPKDMEARNTLFNKVKEFSQEFEKEYGSIICRNLILERKDNPNIKSKPCSEYVKFCVELLDNYLSEM